MLRAASFARWIALALIVGVLVLHVPLDAFRSQADGCLAASCCESTSATADDVVAGCRDEHTVDADASAPLPLDGCDDGCHCGCCGGLPIASDSGPGLSVDAPGALASAVDGPRARCARPLEVFHPPRA